MATLTKRELVVTIANETGLVQHQVFDVVQRTLDHITDALAKGDTVELRNFGILEVRLTKPRVGRNPNQPGSSFVIPARATVKFKAGKIMRQKVSNLSAELKRKEGADDSAAEPEDEDE
jgi:nucleoid DNA-binding protein